MHHHFLIFFLSLLLSACSQNTQYLGSTLKAAFWGNEDINQSKQEILSLPYASCYVTVGDGAQVFMVLALAEPAVHNKQQTQLKWVSSDSAMLVTENGRLVKTLRLLGNNLAGVNQNRSADPLLLDGEKPQYLTWQAIYDWQPDYRFNYAAELSWNFIEEQTVRTSVWEKQTNYYQERVSIPSLDAQFINHFWLDKGTHQVIKSIQTIGPEMQAVEMTILKPFSG